MSKHTPGPWYEMTKGDNRYQSEVAQERTGKTIALTYTSNDADARLIAAAPNMLATLRAIAADCEQYLNDDLELSGGDLCIAFLKAINEVHDKATGSTFASDEPVDEYGEAVAP